jgi:hypothetical protein
MFATVAASVVCVLAFASPARADDGGLQFSIAPYIWFAGINGDASVAGINVPVDKTFSQIIGEADSVLGFFARIDAQYDRLGFYVDGGFTRLAMSTAIPTGTAKATFDTGMADFAMTFRVLDWPGPDINAPGAAVYGLLGGRYMSLSGNLSFPRFSVNQGAQWVDPMIGVEGYVDLGSHFRILLHGDVGGLTNELTWSGAGYVAYVFNIGSVESSVFLGYKAIGEDYSTGSGRSEFAWNTILHGPVLGMSFRF